MSTLDPFPARIVRAEWADHVVSPMHDALSSEERAAILAERPYSWLHVSRTPDDAVNGQAVDPEALDEANAAALERLLDAGLFEEFPEPALYVYRLRSEDHEQTGIVGEVPALAPEPEQLSQVTLVGTLICAVLPSKASASVISIL